MTTGAIGTKGFIAPELEIEPTLAEPAVDIFSLGVSLHYILTSRLPYPTDPTRYLKAARVTDEFTSVLVKCVLPIEDRYTNAKDLLVELRNLPPVGAGAA